MRIYYFEQDIDPWESSLRVIIQNGDQYGYGRFSEVIRELRRGLEGQITDTEKNVLSQIRESDFSDLAFLEARLGECQSDPGLYSPAIELSIMICMVYFYQERKRNATGERARWMEEMAVNQILRRMLEVTDSARLKAFYSRESVKTAFLPPVVRKHMRTWEEAVYEEMVFGKKYCFETLEGKNDFCNLLKSIDRTIREKLGI